VNETEQVEMLSTKFKTVKVGDVIRSLDFPGNFDCYMIGLVTEVEGDLIKCRGISRVWEGKSESMDKPFTTVQEGAHFMDRNHPGRILIVA
jgi:hypothetical protein